MFAIGVFSYGEYRLSFLNRRGRFVVFSFRDVYVFSIVCVSFAEVFG